MRLRANAAPYEVMTVQVKARQQGLAVHTRTTLFVSLRPRRVQLRLQLRILLAHACQLSHENGVRLQRRGCLQLRGN
jgi:hypothetical protein